MYNKFKEYMTSKVVGNAMSLIIAIVFFIIASNFYSLSTYLGDFLRIVSPFIYGFGLAFILNKPAMWFEKKVFHKLSPKKAKGMSIFTTYMYFFVIIFALFVAIIPQTAETLISILDNIPTFIENITKTITDLLNKFNINDEMSSELNAMWGSVSQFISIIDASLVSKILSASVSIGSIIINMITAVISSIYMLLSKDTLCFQIKKVLYALLETKYAERILEIGTRVERIFSSFLIGKMLDSFIIGCICFVVMLFIYSPFALLIAVMIGVTNMIPYFGPFIGAVPCAFILFMVSPMTTVVFVGFIIILQQVDGNIIGPKILGESTGLSAFWVLVSIIIGGGLFGIVGMLIGVPTFAVIYSLVSEALAERLQIKNISVDSENFVIEINDISE
ncbi:MAG: AI-2E family transporter [Clostridia bacterium]